MYNTFLPNGLSLARLLLGLGFPWFPHEWRLVVVAAAMVTDFLDGLTARWLHGESHVGLVLDPLADKVFVLMLGGTLIWEGTLGPWWALAVASRDLVVLSGIGVLMIRGLRSFKSMKPSWIGKCATAAQFTLLAVLVAMDHAWLWLLVATSAVSILAAAEYVGRFLYRTDAAASR